MVNEGTALQLQDIDLNLLVVFRELYLQRRVTPVAETLGLSQPAVSNALARLRRHFDDPLFVRSPAGMQPTPRAEQMAGAVAQALDTLQGALNPRAAFSAARSERTFRIGMTDIGEIYFLPRLMAALATASPGASVSTVRNTAVDLKAAMEAGSVDLAIGLLPTLKTGFFRRRLFTQRYVCLFRRGHPLEGGPVTLAGFSAAEHVVVVSAGTGHGEVDEQLERARVRRQVRLTVPHFVAVGHILQGSDLVATVPERLAQALAGPFDLAFAAHPAPLRDIAISVYWHARLQKDPASQWLRGRVFELFSG